MQIVEPAAHCEIEESNPVVAGEVQMSGKPVRILAVGQFATVQPFQIQRNDAVASEVDAALLLVFDGFAGLSYMAVHIENRRRAGRSFSGSYNSAVEKNPGTISYRNLRMRCPFPKSRPFLRIGAGH